MEELIKKTYFPRDIIFQILSFFEINITKVNDNMNLIGRIGIFIENFRLSKNNIKKIESQCDGIKSFLKYSDSFFISFKLKLIDLYGKWGSKYFKNIYWIYNTIRICIWRNLSNFTLNVFQDDRIFFEKFIKPNRNLSFQYFFPSKEKINENIKKMLFKRGFLQDKENESGIIKTFTKKINVLKNIIITKKYNYFYK